MSARRATRPGSGPEICGTWSDVIDLFFPRHSLISLMHHFSSRHHPFTQTMKYPLDRVNSKVQRGAQITVSAGDFDFDADEIERRR